MMKPHERNLQVVRQWEILKLLEQGGRTVEDLATAVGDRRVTKRTVYRDLEALLTAKFPLYSARDEDGQIRWHLLTKGVTPGRAA